MTYATKFPSIKYYVTTEKYREIVHKMFHNKT